MKTDVKFDKACRCCLVEHEQMKNLLQDTFIATTGESVKLLEGLSKCTGIDPDPEAITSLNICDPCERKLTISYDFREQCQASNRRLEEYSLMVKQELHSDEEPSPPKRGRPAKRKKPNLQTKVSEVPEIIYMKEEPCEIGKENQEEIIKEELKTSENESIGIDNQDFDDGESNSIKANDSNSNDEDSDQGVVDDENNSTEADDERKERAIYQCFHCDTYLLSYSALAKHKNSEHPNEYLQPIKRTCPLCNVKTQHYSKHLKHDHKDFKPNQCKLCHEGYLSHTKLQQHMRVHKTEQSHPHKCLGSDCGKVFATDKGLRHHIKYEKHKNSDKYRCPRCGLDFSEFLPLHTHFKAKHDLQNVKNLFPCYKCKDICKFRRYILEHNCEEAVLKKRNLKKEDRIKAKEVKPRQSEAPVDKNFQCQQCGEWFENEDALTCHRFSICLDEPKFVCVTCGQECANQRRLTAHKRTHKDMTFICEDCGFQAIDRHTLTKHRLCHSDERPAKCDICDAAFKNMNILNIHKQTHGVRKYECALCGHKFKSLRNLKLHMNALHIRPASTYRHECKFCGKMCARNRDLVAHIRGHTGEVSKCHICDRSFRRTSTLKNHIRTVHDGLNLKCVYCNLTFSLKARLKQHLFIHRGFMPFNCSYCSQKFVRKYRFSKHLATHNVVFNEAIHGYQETEDVNAIIAGSLTNPARVGSSEIEKAEGFSLNLPI